MRSRQGGKRERERARERETWTETERDYERRSKGQEPAEKKGKKTERE